MGKPTHLARELKSVVADRGSQVRLHRDSGISQGQISRYISNLETPSVDKLDQLCRALSRQDRVRLVISHLRDETPESVKGEIRITAVSPAEGHSARALFDLPMPKPLRDALYFLAQEAMSNPDVAESIMASSRVLGFKGSARVLYEGHPTKSQKDHLAVAKRSPRKAGKPAV